MRLAGDRLAGLISDFKANARGVSCDYLWCSQCTFSHGEGDLCLRAAKVLDAEFHCALWQLEDEFAISIRIGGNALVTFGNDDLGCGDSLAAAVGNRAIHRAYLVAFDCAEFAHRLRRRGAHGKEA